MDTEVVAAWVGVGGGLGGALVGAVAAYFGAVHAAQKAAQARADPLALEVRKEQIGAYQALIQAMHTLEDEIFQADDDPDVDPFEVLYPREGSVFRAWRWKYLHIAGEAVVEASATWEEALRKAVFKMRSRESAQDELMKLRAAREAVISAARDGLHLKAIDAKTLEMFVTKPENKPVRALP